MALMAEASGAEVKNKEDTEAGGGEVRNRDDAVKKDKKEDEPLPDYDAVVAADVDGQ